MFEYFNVSIAAMSAICSPLTQEKIRFLNTSNPGKLKEFERLFGQHGASLQTTYVDLEEIDADPITVAVHKASQLEEGVIIEDTSLEIEGADVGMNIRLANR